MEAGEYSLYSILIFTSLTSFFREDLSVSDCIIGPIALTDQAAVQFSLVMEPDVVKKNRWRINISLSTDKVGTVWEAYIKGKITAYCSGGKEIKYKQ